MTQGEIIHFKNSIPFSIVFTFKSYLGFYQLGNWIYVDNIPLVYKVLSWRTNVGNKFND